MQTVISLIEAAWPLGRCYDNVLEAQSPLTWYVDTGLDAVGKAILDQPNVARHHVRVLVFFHSDAMPRAMHEVLAVAAIGDDLSCRRVNLFATHANLACGDAS